MRIVTYNGKPTRVIRYATPEEIAEYKLAGEFLLTINGDDYLGKQWVNLTEPVLVVASSFGDTLVNESDTTPFPD